MNHPLVQRLFISLFVIFACVSCDQATKVIAVRELRGTPMRSFLGDTFRLQFAENRGAFLSLGASLSQEQRTIIFSGLVGVFLLGLAVYMVVSRTVSRNQLIALALLVGGGLSNWWDRVARDGLVVDFMNIGIGPVRTGIFNIADIAIMAGAILMVFLGSREKRQQEAAQAATTG